MVQLIISAGQISTRKGGRWKGKPKAGCLTALSGQVGLLWNPRGAWTLAEVWVVVIHHNHWCSLLQPGKSASRSPAWRWTRAQSGKGSSKNYGLLSGSIFKSTQVIWEPKLPWIAFRVIFLTDDVKVLPSFCSKNWLLFNMGVLTSGLTVTSTSFSWKIWHKEEGLQCFEM